MTDPFKVSVIIPVFNASRFLERAVKSTQEQPEVAEIILIEDGSQDNSYEICKALKSLDSRIVLLTHAGRANKGAGASRNLGVVHAQCEFVAFLDADDTFLPGRFTLSKKLFSNPVVDAVYEPVTCEFIDEKSKIDFSKMVGIDLSNADEHISYPFKKLHGKDFFTSLILENNGFPMTDGIVVKKSLFEKAGLFNEGLRLHQDSEMWVRLSYHGFFSTPDETVPVARRTQHPNNRIIMRNASSRLKYYEALLSWSKSVNIESKLKRHILKRLCFFSEMKNSAKPSLLIKFKWRIKYGLLILFRE